MLRLYKAKEVSWIPVCVVFWAAKGSLLLFENSRVVACEMTAEQFHCTLPSAVQMYGKEVLSL